MRGCPIGVFLPCACVSACSLGWAAVLANSRRRRHHLDPKLDVMPRAHVGVRAVPYHAMWCNMEALGAMLKTHIFEKCGE